MNETQKLAKTVRQVIEGFLVGLLVLGVFALVFGDDDDAPSRIDTYCDGTTKVYLGENESFELLPASIDCTDDVNGG